MKVLTKIKTGLTAFEIAALGALTLLLLVAMSFLLAATIGEIVGMGNEKIVDLAVVFIILPTYLSLLVSIIKGVI